MSPDSQDSQATLVNSKSQILSPKKASFTITTPRRASQRTKAFSIFSDRPSSPLTNNTTPRAPGRGIPIIYVEIPRLSLATKTLFYSIRTPLTQVGQS
jgi:hypothetical protein